MSQQSMRQAARRPALDAQAARRRERVDRERRLERLAVAVLTALGDRNRAVRDAKRRAGEALRVMTDDEGLSVPEAADSAAAASQCGRSPGCAVWRTSLRLATLNARRDTVNARRVSPASLTGPPGRKRPRWPPSGSGRQWSMRQGRHGRQLRSSANGLDRVRGVGYGSVCLAGLPNRVHSMRSRASCGFFVWLDEPAGYLRSAEQPAAAA